VERAARNAVAETMGAASETGEVALLRASLADLRAHQVASEQRMQSTLTGVYSALERLVGRMGTADPDAPLPLTPRAPRDLSNRDTAREPGAEQPAGAGPPRRPDPVRAERAQVSGPDLPLEPGAGRPGRERSAGRIETGDSTAADSDIKTSFIAAARRAAQAAQAEAAGQTGATDADGTRNAADAGQRESRFGRFRSGIDRRRKPLLLGLAAVVLLLGALQALNARRTSGTEQAAAEPVAALSAPANRDAGPASETATKSPEAKSSEAKSSDGKSTGPSVADPQTTQSLAEGAPAKAAEPAGRSLVPRVTTMAGLSADLAVVPPALVKLRQAALDGDGAAAYDLGMRAAEGRGMGRDPALAVKIFEQIAASGFAPAQYKLGSLYEKGVGVARDLNQAKLWYGRAAELGNARAMHNLAVIHAENPAAGGKPDFATASLWFKRAAEFGLRDSQYNLAVLYARGMGVQQDLAQSFLWFSAAAAQGDEDAAKKRDDVAAKLDAKALGAARAQVAAFKPKVPEPASNEIPAPLPTENTMSLLGAPPPSGNVPPARRI
jgi:localization factor PodJL